VESMLGTNRVKVRSMDDKTRMRRIPGQNEKASLAACQRCHHYGALDFLRHKADIIWLYQATQVEWLKKNGHL
jgi:translation initiation factor 1A